MELLLGDYSIRSFRRSDADSLARHADNHKVSRFLRDSFPHPYTRADAETWIRFVHSQEPETNFVLADSEEAVGGIGLRMCFDVHRLGAELGYWIAEPHWGKGIMTRAVKEFTAYAFTQYNLERIWAGVFEKNPASSRVLEKAGYRYEGTHRSAVVKDGEVMDEIIFATLVDDWLPG